ncbi:MAG: InlB B-repeat-containing protein [Treponema sp.]|nr:InlB B-repeat-containing protein [Treponema sp.]
MKKKAAGSVRVTIFSVLILLSSLPLFAFDGSGTAEEPFIIANATDWATFASNIAAGTDTTAYYKLSDEFDNSENPVTASEIVCTTANCFQGFFDGNGKTLTVNISSTTDAVAPFMAIKNATISNLKVNGSVSGGIHCAALVGRASGTDNKILNCQLCVAITTSGTHCGGFIGHGGAANITIENCIFTGSITGSTTATGVIYGWGDSGTHTVKNCLINATFSNCGGIAVLKQGGGNSNVSNCYYLNTAIESATDASEMTNAELLTLLGDEWEIQDEELSPIMNLYSVSLSNLSGLKNYYSYTGSTIDLSYTVSDFWNELLTENTDYTVSFSDSNNNTVSTPIEKDLYTITIKGIGKYRGTKKVSFYIIFAGSGTETDPYLIETTEDWNIFAGRTNDGETFEGKYFELTSDLDFGGVEGAFNSAGISSDSMINASHRDSATKELYNGYIRDTPAFGGIFNGQNHSISGIKNSQGLFSKIISTGVIKNLVLKDSTISGKFRIGGITGINCGTITNCHVTSDVYINSTWTPNSNENLTDGNLSHGGISGHNMGGTVEGCSSAAVVNTRYSNHYYFSGIVGYNSNSGAIKNCFYYGSEVFCSDYYGAICGYNYSGTITSCLHTYSSLGGINKSDISGSASYAQTITIKTEDISLNTDIDGAVSYGRITAVAGCLIFDNSIYAPAGQTLNIAFSCEDDKIDENYLSYEYKYTIDSETTTNKFTKNDDGTYSFTMPEADVNVYAGYEWTGEGTEASPYIIENIYQLKFLSTRVNYLENTYEGKYFLLTNHLIFDGSENNFEPIGGYYNGSTQDFCGIFQDESSETNSSAHGTHIIMGINVTKTGTSNEDKYIGLFGRIGSTGAVKYINLQDCYFEGHASVGGIAGYNAGTLTTCTTAASVKISGQNPSSSNHGGIAGYNTGKIIQCASSAEVSNYSCAGGIAGNNSGGVLMGCMYYGETSEPVLTTVSYAGSLVGHFESGTLSQNYYSGTSTNAVGKVSYSEDVSGATRAYTISSELGTLSLRNDLGSRGLAYNSILFSPESLSIKISFDSYTPDDSITLGLAAKNGDGENFLFETIENGVYSFTMPSYDVTVVQIARVSFETKGGSEISDKYVTLGESLGTIENPTKGNGEAFEGWYLDADFTEEFDLSSKITKNITLYANFSEGLEITANKNPYAEGEFYTTFYYPKKNCRADTNTRVFYVTKFKNGKVSLEEEESKLIPKGQAVILKSSSPNLSLIFTENTGNFEYENILSGTDKEIEAAEEGTYILSLSKKGGVGFYKWSGKISSHKAFLIMSNEE